MEMLSNYGSITDDEWCRFCVGVIGFSGMVIKGIREERKGQRERAEKEK